MNDNTLSNKDVKKMKDNIQKEIQERREHAERLKKIALKLFEQLKSEKIDFSDAEHIVSMLSASVKSERDNRML
jgi:hypothetical protein|nr:MAG TPA: hypothetical protein [Caudoviricetes sp.]